MKSVGVIEFRKALISQASQKMDIAVGTVVKKLAADAFKGVTDLTPVNTGRARASWALALNSPSEFLPPEIPAPQLAEHKAAKKAGQAPPAILPKPDVPEDVLSQIDGKQKVFITSNLVYMGPLENGHSQQAPAGMVRLTIAALELGLKQAIG